MLTEWFQLTNYNQKKKYEQDYTDIFVPFTKSFTRWWMNHKRLKSTRVSDLLNKRERKLKLQRYKSIK